MGFLRKLAPFLRLALMVGLSLGALYLAARRVSLGDLRVSLAQADWRWVVFTCLCTMGNILLKGLRWKYLCGSPGRKISLARYLGLLLAGQLLNWIYPARLGDILRIQGLGERGPGRAFVLGTLVTEKTLDTVAYAVLLVVLMAVTPLLPWIRLSIVSVIVLALGLLVGVGVLAQTGHRAMPTLERFWERLSSRPLVWFKQRVSSMLASLEILKDWRLIGGLAVLTVFGWLTAVANNWLAFCALQLELPWLAAALLLAALQAGITLPSGPGSVGVFEYACVLVLGLWQVPEATALGYGILLHAIVMSPALIGGMIYLLLAGGVPRSVN
jgi:uncharacterized protein (TIRG00374 family)